MPWDEDDVRLAWTYRATKLGRMCQIDAYGGSLTENVIQALARDLLVYAMFRCRKEGLPIILTVHDEIVLELLLNGDPQKLLDMLIQIMEDIPAWAREIKVPIQVEGWVSEMYKK
jgi:DNA polymerase